MSHDPYEGFARRYDLFYGTQKRAIGSSSLRGNDPGVM